MDVLATVIAALFTIASPVVIAWKKSPNWSTALKTGVPIVVSIVIAIAYLAYTGGFNDSVDIFTTILTVYGIQQLVYATILKRITEKLEWSGHEESEAGVPQRPKHSAEEPYPDIGT